MEALFLKIEPVCTQKEAPMEKMEAGEIHVEALRTTQEAHCTPVESGVITREAERARNRQSAENERHFGPTPSPGMSVSGPLSSLPQTTRTRGCPIPDSSVRFVGSTRGRALSTFRQKTQSFQSGIHAGLLNGAGRIFSDAHGALLRINFLNECRAHGFSTE